MIAQGRPESIFDDHTDWSRVDALVGVDILVIVLANIGVNRLGGANRIVVIADCGDELGLPAFHQIRHTSGFGAVLAKVADNGKPERITCRQCSGWRLSHQGNCFCWCSVG